MGSGKRATKIEIASAIGIMLAGLAVLLRPLLLDGAGRAPGDLGDGRFIHYLLEHSWQWITRNPHHPLWDPPYYFPVRGVGAYSDLMAGSGPLYWPWRLAGLGAGNAYFAWLVTVAVLNILIAFVVFQRCLRFSVLAAATGATFITVAAPLQNQSNHPQMLPQFYLLGMFAGAVMLVRGARELSPLTHRALWSALVVGCFVLQMYTAFYYAWFALLAAGIATAWGLMLSSTRPQVIGIVRHTWRMLLISGLLGGIALIPWAMHYLDAASLNPSITYQQMSGWIPRWESWFYLGPNSPAYDWMIDWRQLAAIPDGTDHEHRLGVGLVTSGLIALGYITHYRMPWARVSVLVAITLVLMTTILPGGVTAWRFFFEILPGATAVRTLTRVALIVLIPMAVGLALFAERLRSARRVYLAPLLIACVLAEQVIDYPTYDIDDAIDRSARIAREIPDECSSFLSSPRVAANQAGPPVYVVQLDAMWAGLLADTPTVNAYGHIVPPEWPFAEPIIVTPADETRLLGAINEWEALHPEAARVCHVVSEAAP